MVSTRWTGAATQEDGGRLHDVIDPNELTPAWLTKALAAQGALGNASVVSCAAEPLAAMSFTGVFERLELGYDFDDPALPRSLIGKFSTPDPEQRAMIKSIGSYAREVAFYRELASTTPVPVPICYYAAVDDSDGRCVILLQDLTTARRGRSIDCCPVSEIELTIDAIAPLHARWWRTFDVAAHPWLDPDTVLPMATMESMFEAQWPVFMEKLSIPITDRIRQFGDWAATQLGPILQRMFHEPPLTVIHHDLQADNLLFGRTSESAPVTVIDWQLVGVGHGLIDVAYLLSGSMDPKDRRRHERELLARYVARLQAGGVWEYDIDRCVEDYRAALLLPPVRLACAVALTSTMTAHPGAFWDQLFERQIRALTENAVFGV